MLAPWVSSPTAASDAIHAFDEKALYRDIIRRRVQQHRPPVAMESLELDPPGSNARIYKRGPEAYPDRPALPHELDPKTASRNQ